MDCLFFVVHSPCAPSSAASREATADSIVLCDRYIRVSPTGRLFFDVGAPCNDCLLTKAFGNITFGSINSMALNGTDIRPWAEGELLLWPYQSLLEPLFAA